MSIKVKTAAASDNPLEFPRILPHHGLNEYYQSKVMAKIIKPTVSWDDLERTSLIKINTHNVDRESKRRLSQSKAKFMRIRRALDARWNALLDSRNLLRKDLLECESFVQSNGEKRERKTIDIVNFQAKQKEYAEKSEDIMKRIEFLRDIKARMEERIATHSIFEQFLQDTAKYSLEFKTAVDIVLRYDTLQDARHAIFDNQVNQRIRWYNNFAAMNTFMNETTLAQLGMYNQVGRLHSQYEIAKSKTLKWENVLSSIHQEMDKRMAEMKLVKMSCRNIYLNICARRKVKKIHENDFRKELKCIRKDLLCMKTLAKM